MHFIIDMVVLGGFKGAEAELSKVWYSLVVLEGLGFQFPYRDK